MQLCCCCKLSDELNGHRNDTVMLWVKTWSCFASGEKFTVYQIVRGLTTYKNFKRSLEVPRAFSVSFGSDK